MLHTEDKTVRALLLRGNFGLEKEMLRITTDGHFSHAPHPFAADDPHITRDFCENQIEINTPIFSTAAEVTDCIGAQTRRVREVLQRLTPCEHLWQYSNPPYISNEEDIPIAQFCGNQATKTSYRNYLSQRYGRYLMTFSGIHFNYSFAGDLIRKNYEVETGVAVTKGAEPAGFREYSDSLYLNLAKNLVTHGWLMTVLTAASPLTDSSYFEQGDTGRDVFCGIASMRCSELGYWNEFAPLFDYSTIDLYVESIERYVRTGLIAAASELYYPIRLKPKGANTLERLRQQGVNHVELRMIDLNPLSPYGIEEADVLFAQLLTVWAASTPALPLDALQQMASIANFKQAAHYDLHTAGIIVPDGHRTSVAEAAAGLLEHIECFYRQMDAPAQVFEALHYQQAKLEYPDRYRYANLVRQRFGGNLVGNLISYFSHA